MITGNDIIFIMGPSVVGKTSLSTRLCEMVDGHHINIDTFFRIKPKLSYYLKNYEQEIFKEWYKNVSPRMTKYLKKSLKEYVQNRGLNIIDLGGVASFPVTETDLREYRELVTKYNNFFLILPSKRLCEISKIISQRSLLSEKPNKSLTGAINFFNLSRLNKIYEIFPEYDGTVKSIENRIIYQDDFVDLYLRSEDDHWIEEEIIQRAKINDLNKEIYLNNILNKKEEMQSWQAKVEKDEAQKTMEKIEQLQSVGEKKLIIDDPGLNLKNVISDKIKSLETNQ